MQAALERALIRIQVAERSSRRGSERRYRGALARGAATWRSPVLNRGAACCAARAGAPRRSARGSSPCTSTC